MLSQDRDCFLVSFYVLRTGHGSSQAGGLDRKVRCSPLADGVLLSVTSSQGKISLSFLGLSLGVVQELARVLDIAASVGMSLAFKELFSTARNIYCVSQLKPDKRAEWVLF